MITAEAPSTREASPRTVYAAVGRPAAVTVATQVLNCFIDGLTAGGLSILPVTVPKSEAEEPHRVEVTSELSGVHWSWTTRQLTLFSDF